MRTVQVNASKKYEVMIGRGLLPSIGTLLKEDGLSGKVAIITDSKVNTLYSEEVADALIWAGFEAVKFVFQEGEESKNLQNYFNILSFLGSKGFTRTDTVLALGGGVVGDIAGFAAGTYMRGINFVQVPTTLLAGIDSSVGGKTAVNLPQGKNLAGCFYQPCRVIFDLNTLSTLDSLEIKNGIGEGIKYAVLEGGRLFEILESGLTSINMEEFVELCVKIKRDIVEKDERESGLRKMLNLGHTVAHSIEINSDFAVPHGLAVGIGIAVMARLSHKRGELPPVSLDRIIAVLHKYDLPVDGFEADMLIENMKMDKKVGEGYITLVTVAEIGDCRLTSIKLSELENYFL